MPAWIRLTGIVGCDVCATRHTDRDIAETKAARTDFLIDDSPGNPNLGLVPISLDSTNLELVARKDGSGDR
jgi:hypothetical protein